MELRNENNVWVGDGVCSDENRVKIKARLEKEKGEKERECVCTGQVSPHQSRMDHPCCHINMLQSVSIKNRCSVAPTISLFPAHFHKWIIDSPPIVTH